MCLRCKNEASVFMKVAQGRLMDEFRSCGGSLQEMLQCLRAIQDSAAGAIGAFICRKTGCNAPFYKAQVTDEFINVYHNPNGANDTRQFTHFCRHGYYTPPCLVCHRQFCKDRRHHRYNPPSQCPELMCKHSGPIISYLRAIRNQNTGSATTLASPTKLCKKKKIIIPVLLRLVFDCTRRTFKT